MTNEEKALAILRAIAESVKEESENKKIEISPDWGFGTATITFADGSHTHIGSDSGNDDQNFEAFVDGLYELLCLGQGLSFVPSKLSKSADVANHLKSLGWSALEAGLADGLYVFENPVFPRRQLVFPVDETAPDYLESLNTAVSKLTELHRQHEAELRMIERGTKAWAGVENPSAWLDDLRGNLEKLGNNDKSV